MDIERYIEAHPRLHLRRSGNRGQWRGWCPFHPEGTYDCFSINVASGEWLCRSSRCGLQGGFPLFYKLLEGIRSWRDVRLALDLRVPVQNWAEVLGLGVESDLVPCEVRQQLPDEVFHVPITEANFPPYLRTERHLDPSVAQLGFDLRWCFAGDYRDRVLLPFYDLGCELVTFAARLMRAGAVNAADRYRFPDGATTNRFLYGVWRLNYYASVPRIWVVEGQFDVVRLATWGEVAVGMSTSAPTTRQFLDLISLARLYNADLIVCGDSGALAKTRTTWAQLVALGWRRTYPVDIEGIAKDPGELYEAGQLNALLTRVYAVSSDAHSNNV